MNLLTKMKNLCSKFDNSEAFVLIHTKEEYDALVKFVEEIGYHWGDSDRYEYYARLDKDEIPVLSLYAPNKRILAFRLNEDVPSISIAEFFSRLGISVPPYPQYAIPQLTIE